ncbi:MAG: HD domain-containing protein [Chloroflexota bacterium]
MAVQQRIRQGIRALFAFTRSVDYALAADYLNEAQLDLLKQLSRAEQLHSINVLRDVQAQGKVPIDLAQAALLHDVGKSRWPLAIWQKTIVVIFRKLSPEQFTRWGQGQPDNPWRRPFVATMQHPAWSAEMAARVGLSERALWLIAHHADDFEQWQQHPYAPLLKRLQQADDAN